MLKKVAIAALTGILLSVFPICDASAAPSGYAAILTEPGGADQSVDLSSQPVIQVRYSNGDTYEDFNGTVEAEISSGTGDLLGNTVINVSSGIAVFTNLQISTPGIGFKLTFTPRLGAFSLTSAESNSFDIRDTESPVITSELFTIYGSGLSVPQNLALEAPEDVVTAIDNLDGDISANILTQFFSPNDCPVISNIDEARGCLAAAWDNTVTVTYSVSDMAGNLDEVSVTFTSTRAVPSAIFSTVTATHEDLIANGSDASTITITLFDDQGYPLTLGGDTITFAYTSLGGFSPITDNNDGSYTATYTTYPVEGNSSGYDLITPEVNGDSFPVESSVSIVVTQVPPPLPSATTSTVSVSSPSITADGVSSTTITVQLKFANGDNVTVGGENITFALTTLGTISGPATDNGDGTYWATYVAGYIAGTETIIPQLGDSTFTFTTSISLTAGPAAQIMMNGPETQSAGVGDPVTTLPSVVVKDEWNNPVSGVSVTFAIETGDGVVSGGGATTGLDGVATVISWTLGPNAGSNTLSATAVGLTGSPITFTATAYEIGPATATAIDTQPSGATSGEVFTTQPVIRIVDADDNTVTSFTGNVTVGIASGTGTLGGTTTVAAVAGVATFTDLGILGLGAFTLIFTSESLSSITSESFNLSGGGLSSDATLSSLTLSPTTALTPTFVSGTSTYTASVSNATTSVTVTPIKSQANATIKVKVNSGSYATVISGSASSSLSLNVGSNTIYVEVTAEDATTILTYTITVTRAVAVAASGAMEYEIVYKSNTVDNTSVQQDPRGYYKSGTTITVLTQEPSRRGYTFLIWNNKADGTGTSYKPGSKFDITKNITLFAQWKINQYTLSYSANGGPALTLASKTEDYGSYIKVLSVPESSMRTGYSFTAWNTKADGTGVSYVPTDIFVVDVVDTTLFAQWKINTYTISFDANGGPELKLDAITLEYGASVKVPSLPDASLRTGYSFMGWNIKSDGTGTSYLPASAFTMATSNTTFFAQWKINQYIISFSANGGPELKLESITQDYASVIKLPALPVESMRTGYTFIGWNTKNDGLGTSYGAAENFTLGAANTVLFAHWKINQYSISYDANGNNIGRAPALSSQDFNSTVVVAAPSRVFVRSGYSFIGWSKAKDGSGKLYQIGDAFTLGAGNELFYAAWKPNTYKVTFLNTTKDVLPTATFQTSGLITSAPTPPARPGYSFMGWSSRASKTDIITLPYSPGVLKNITLYAVWVRTK